MIYFIQENFLGVIHKFGKIKLISSKRSTGNIELVNRKYYLEILNMEQWKNANSLAEFLVAVQLYIQEICKGLSETLESHWGIKFKRSIQLYE